MLSTGVAFIIILMEPSAYCCGSKDVQLATAAKVLDFNSHVNPVRNRVDPPRVVSFQINY